MAKYRTSPCTPGFEPGKSRIKLVRTSKTRTAPLTLTLPRGQLLDGSDLSHQQNQSFRSVFDGRSYLPEILLNSHHAITLKTGYTPRHEGFLLNAPLVQGSATSEKFSADLSESLDFMKKVLEVLGGRAGKFSATYQTQPSANKFAGIQQSCLQGSSKQDCTNPPIKDAQSASPCTVQGAARAPRERGAPGEPSAPGADAAPHAYAAAPAAAAPPANAARKHKGCPLPVTEPSRVTGQDAPCESRVARVSVTLMLVEKITGLTPPHGTERLSIAPCGGVESPSTAPCGGAIRECFGHRSTPPHGDHLEKPSASGFKPSTSEKFSASHHDDCCTDLKGKQPSLFTGGAALCYIACKPRGPVLETTKPAEVATPTVKRGFVTPKFMGLTRLRAFTLTVTGGMSLSVRLATRLLAWFQHPVHHMRLKPLLVAYFGSPAGIQTMTVSTKASGRAVPSPTTMGAPDPIQLHADAHNALNMAVFYLRQPDANVAGARRKAIQALSALRGLSLALEE